MRMLQPNRLKQIPVLKKVKTSKAKCWERCQIKLTGKFCKNNSLQFIRTLQSLTGFLKTCRRRQPSKKLWCSTLCLARTRWWSALPTKRKTGLTSGTWASSQTALLCSGTTTRSFWRLQKFPSSQTRKLIHSGTKKRDPKIHSQRRKRRNWNSKAKRVKRSRTRKCNRYQQASLPAALSFELERKVVKKQLINTLKLMHGVISW